MSRFINLQPEDMTPRQREIYEGIAGGRRGEVAALFQILLQSPELCAKMSQVGEFLRYDVVMPPRLTELAIIVSARHAKSKFEWFFHCREALKGGVPHHEVEAVAEGRRPDFEDDDAATVYDFAVELLETGNVSEKVYANAVAAFGVGGAVELAAMVGNYQTIAGILRIFDAPDPGEPEIPLQV
jgi:4-carboxymuconolactone decarboxylase